MEACKGGNEDPGETRGGETLSPIVSTFRESSYNTTCPDSTCTDEDPKHTLSPIVQDVSSSGSLGTKGVNTGSGMVASPVAFAECTDSTAKADSLKLPSRKKRVLSDHDRSMLRKGKWTVEEEEYTSRIIHFFNSGLLTLPEGYTLRSYLAEKLNCDPMRVTKKYAGAACLGRRAYHYRDRPQPTVTEIQLAKAQLDELEHRFRMRVEEGYTGSPPPSTLDVLSSLQQQAGNPVLSLAMSQQQHQAQNAQQQQINAVAAIQTLLLSVLGASQAAANQPAPAPNVPWSNGVSWLQAAVPAPSTGLPTASAPVGQWILPQTGAPALSAPAPAALLPAAHVPAGSFPAANAAVLSLSNAPAPVPAQNPPVVQSAHVPPMPLHNMQAPSMPVQAAQAPALLAQLLRAPTMPTQNTQSSPSSVLQPTFLPKTQSLDPSLLSRLELTLPRGNVGSSATAKAQPTSREQQVVLPLPGCLLTAQLQPLPSEAPPTNVNLQGASPSQHSDELRKAFERHARAEGIELPGTASASADDGGGLLETLAKKPSTVEKAEAAPTAKKPRTDEEEAAGSILLGFLSSLRESYLDAVNEKQKQEREEGQSSSSGTMSSSNMQIDTALPGTIPMRFATVTDSSSSQQGSVEDCDWSSERKSDSSEESDKEVQAKEQSRGPPRKRHKKMVPRIESGS